VSARDDARLPAPTPHIDDHDDHHELAAATCGDATAANIEGPFYRAYAPRRAVLAGLDEPGERFVVSGVVRDQRCKPVRGAILDIWQADAKGGYDLKEFHLRGTLKTDDEGRYELHTIVPGHYLNGDRYRPAHIHVKVWTRGREPLTTQLYFAGDPYNDGDPFIVPSLIMQHSGGRARFDFTLADA
jgi:catechol 1,2-dioxygenase